MKTKAIAIRLDEELLKEFDSARKRVQQQSLFRLLPSRAAIIRQAIRAWIRTVDE